MTWQAIDLDLPDKPKVRRIARALGIDRDAVAGKLLRVWAWFNRVSVDGVVDGVVDTDIDDLARQDGFAGAMVAADWLVIDAEQQRISIPDFHIHNGDSAKKRLLKSNRQARWRAGAADRTVDAKEVQQASTSVDVPVDAAPSTTEQNRTSKKKEQKDTPSPTATAEPMPEVPKWVSSEAWDGFVAMRKRERHPLTPRAAKLVLGELQKLSAAGFEPNAVLDQSTRNGWRDVFPIRDQNARAGPQPVGKTMQAINQLERMKDDAKLRLASDRSDNGTAKAALPESGRAASG